MSNSKFLRKVVIVSLSYSFCMILRATVLTRVSKNQRRKLQAISVRLDFLKCVIFLKMQIGTETWKIGLDFLVRFAFWRKQKSGFTRENQDGQRLFKVSLSSTGFCNFLAPSHRVIWRPRQVTLNAQCTYLSKNIDHWNTYLLSIYLSYLSIYRIYLSIYLPTYQSKRISIFNC